jgi:hypothetical protein
MDEQTKKWALLAGLAVIVFVPVLMWSTLKTPARISGGSQNEGFVVNGDGKTVFVPDVAQFTFNVITNGQGKDIQSLQKQNTETANTVIKFLKDNGIKDQDITTQSYDLYPQYQYSGGASRINGYEINQGVSVKVRDMDKAGDVLAGVVSSGANSVSQLKFTVDDPEDIKNQARIKAVKNAKERAKKIASATGIRLGRIISIEENFTSDPVTAYNGTLAKGMGGSDIAVPSPDIQSGSQEVAVSVMLRYEIK